MGTKRICHVEMSLSVTIYRWPLIKADFHGVSSQTGRIKTTRNGVSVDSDDMSVCMTALSMFSGLYSVLAMQELVKRKK